VAILLAGSLILPCLQSARGAGAKYGRLAGVVADPQGDPLLGANVLVTGPVPLPSASTETGGTLERVITDAQGKFAVEHLLPGWYSLQVTSPTRVPALRNGVRVEAGQTSTERFVLADIFAPLRIQLSKTTASSWGDDWKWVLRASAATRPILRYQQEVAHAAPKPSRGPSQRLIGMVPGAARRDPLPGDPGLGSVMAYLRPLSDDSDLLIVGSMNANGVQASSVATALRKNLVRGDPQELSLVVHQLSLSDGVPMPLGNSQNPLAHAEGAVVSYTRTRRLSPGVTLTAGMEVNCLNAVRTVMTVQPNMKLEYQVNAGTVVAIQYGTGRPDSFDTLLERVGMLNTFPRVTLRDYHPRLEQLNHAEVSLHRRLSKASRVELAAYHDALHNAAVWGAGHVSGADWLAGDLLPYPASMYGVILNAGDYQAAGFRAAYSQDLGKHIQAVVAYSLGDALTARGAANFGSVVGLQDLLRAALTASLAGKVSVLTPVTHTQLTTSYAWVPQGRVTFVDPYGQANLQLQPYLGIQIRQPLPTLAFFPARIEALADCRNLLAQGYVPVARPGEKGVLLSSAYRSFRGGFSVQF
jgi:hypothetical protein